MLGFVLVCSAGVVADGYQFVGTLNECNVFARNYSAMKFCSFYHLTSPLNLATKKKWNV